MFWKKNLLTIRLDKEGDFKISHNLKGLSTSQIEKLITILSMGQIGAALLESLAQQSPEMNQFCDLLHSKLNPPPPINFEPVIKPSQVIPNFIAQIKDIMHE